MEYKELSDEEKELINIIRDSVSNKKFGDLKLMFNDGKIDLKQNHRIKLIEEKDVINIIRYYVSNKKFGDLKLIINEGKIDLDINKRIRLTK